MALRIPGGLAASCSNAPERSERLDRLPDVVRKLEQLRHTHPRTDMPGIRDPGGCRGSLPRFPFSGRCAQRGAKVRMLGLYVLDSAQGWIEIRPVSGIEVLH